MLLSEFQAVRVLASGPSTLSRLASRLGLSPAALTSLARGLVERGWARSNPDPSDRRASLLRVTPRGRRAMLEARREYRAGLRELEQGLSSSERQELARGLSALRRALGPPPEARAKG